jgi:serine phosphatase RsbU (regulator of sigma subunit)
MMDEAYYQARIHKLEDELDALTAALAQAWDQLVPFLQEAPQQAKSTQDIAPVIEALMTGVDAPFGAVYLLPREGLPQEWFALPDDGIAFAALEAFLAALVKQNETQCAFDVPTRAGALTRWMFMPMNVSGEVIGALGVGFFDQAHELSALDMRMLTRMSERAANQLIAARLEESRAREAKMLHELEIAGNIQRSIQPGSAPRAANLDAAAEWQPASNVGGDAWGWVIQPSGKLACFMVDVAGKGLPAALAAVSLHTALRLVLRLDMTPAMTLQAVNQEFYEPYTNAGILATAAVIAIDPQTGAYELANAGHVPILVRVDKQWHSYDASMPPLGVLPEALPTMDKGVLNFSDMIILYSDGLSEIETGGALWGETGILNAIPPQFDSMRHVIDAVFGGAKAFRGSAVPHDDQTMLALQFLGGRT